MTHIGFMTGACSVVGGIVLSAALFGTGAASADDYAGITYSEAVGKASTSGRTPIVATVVGGRTALDDCVVTSSQAGKWPNMIFNLSCVALQASATTPGGSIMDARSREFESEKEARDLEWKQSAEGQEWCEEAQTDHPEWGPIAGCND